MKMKGTVTIILMCTGWALAAGAESENTAKYNVNVEAVGTHSAIISSTGTCGSATCVSVISVQNLSGSNEDGSVFDEEAFSYAILCGGNFDFRGCASISSSAGRVLFHSNGSMMLKGNCDALIDLSSSGSITTKGNSTVSGSMTENVPHITIPDIDLTPYYNWALEHGEVYSSLPNNSGTLEPEGGILWINGDVHFASHTMIKGSVIATGAIKTSAGVKIIPSDTCAFGLVSRDSDIEVVAHATVNGLTYAKTGGLKLSGQGLINGQVIVNGNIMVTGSSDIMTSYGQNIPSPPNGTSTADYIAIAAWQK